MPLVSGLAFEVWRASSVGGDANGFDLPDDADGTITLSDGSTVQFCDIERIDF
jgi:hypothetical protein